MPFTIVTLSKAPTSLRGDLSKWMQEIAPGIFVGNFNSKIREELWTRIVDSVRNGEATMSYAFRNEIGYQFITHNTESKVIDFDGIPLVMVPNPELDGDSRQKTGFSDAAKRRAAKRFSSKGSGTPGTDDGSKSVCKAKPYVVIDIETDGLDKSRNRIIEIGAVKVQNETMHYFSSLISQSKKLPGDIVKLTGISDNELEEGGHDEQEVLTEFITFIEDLDLVGYNISFDIGFISNALERLSMPAISNKVFDLLKFVKRERIFLEDYKLQTVLEDYGITDKIPHRALLDAKIIFELSLKVNLFQLTLK